ncbi:hypothetical protein [Ktedonobacter robiniae]|uniref:Caspase family p20 domain-containing protein n=1 Tax=Ktedonobacter robiniae TaxID=2778365 RepID=A0ABQ3UP90_9CHLR|nr:hypothetical protein [Ktedonobacter robiniae]GHO54472.1 hypothetical protein KSB_29470 [Ktedonobacter robiniae]
MEAQEPSPQTTLLILLGASAWPFYPEFQSSEAFANAARRLKAYFLNPRLFGLPAENLLDLFDSDKSADELDTAIGQFLEQRLTIMKAAGNAGRDLLLYFIGHGGFVGRDSDFFLAIRRTRTENPRASSMQVLSLADTLAERARHLRRMIILDCCFAAAAFRDFQAGGPDQVAQQKTIEAFEVKRKTRGFPSKGTTLLCSSSHTSPSRLLPDSSWTMFSKAFLDTLVEGTAIQQEYLSLRDVKDNAADLLHEIRNAPLPVVLSPDQSEGDVADIPFFPNPWFEKYQSRKAAEEQASKAQDKDALEADETLIRPGEAQPVYSASELEMPHSGEEKQKAVDEQVPKVEEALEKPADQSENQRSLFARQFLRPSHKSAAPLKFSRLSQSQSSLGTLNNPSGPTPQPVHAPLNVKTRDEFLNETLGAWDEPYLPWFTAFALLAGLGIGADTIIRSSVPYSWLWSMGTVLVAAPLIYLTAYRKVVNISIMIIIALISAAGASGLAAYTSSFTHPSDTSNFFLFGLSQRVWLDRQLYIGLIVGGGMGLFASVVGILSEGLDELWELIWVSHQWGPIIWLGLAILTFLVNLVSHVEWGFGFGYGWDISLMAVEAGILTPLGITYWLTFWIKGAKVKIIQ